MHCGARAPCASVLVVEGDFEADFKPQNELI
jgi:hypothetical protein